MSGNTELPLATTIEAVDPIMAAEPVEPAARWLVGHAGVRVNPVELD